MTVTLVELVSPVCRLLVAPEIGGRIVSLVARLGTEEHEVLWRNSAVKLERSAPGSEYDPVFYGGIDELLPCDLPEVIDDIPYPDHGELWTASLEMTRPDDMTISLIGHLPCSGLLYERRMHLARDDARVNFHYRLTNTSSMKRNFLWKLHASLSILPGDVVECPAKWAEPIDLAYSACPTLQRFPWPNLDGRDKSIIGDADGTCEFLYLYCLSEGRMELRSPTRDYRVSYLFDKSIFKYTWLFQSFGGFCGHYTTVLEPCTAMPISVPAAAALGQCSVLEPDESMTTDVSLVIQQLGVKGGVL